MTIKYPSTTIIASEPMDPYDNIDYAINIANMLEVGEIPGSWYMSVLPEASLLGLQMGTGTKAPVLVGDYIVIWLSIISSEQNNVIFDGTGVILPLEVCVTSNSVPSRIKQRTIGVRVAQR